MRSLGELEKHRDGLRRDDVAFYVTLLSRAQASYRTEVYPARFVGHALSMTKCIFTSGGMDPKTTYWTVSASIYVDFATVLPSAQRNPPPPRPAIVAK